MITEIISVTKKDVEEVTTNEPLPLYRRYSPDHWEHYLGDFAGWRRYIVTQFLEAAYKRWQKKIKPTTL